MFLFNKNTQILKHELALIIEYEYGIYYQPEKIQDQIELLRKLDTIKT